MAGIGPIARDTQLPAAQAAPDARRTGAAAGPGDRVALGQPARPSAPTLLHAHDAAVTGATAVSNAAKGAAADRALPQRYRLQALTPDAARGKTSNAAIIDTKRGRPDATTGKPRGEWVVRTDGPHRGAPDFHVNRNPKLTGVPDPHTPIPEGAFKAAGTAARALEGVERVAVPVAVAVDAARLGNAYHEDGNRVGQHTIHTAGSVAGGWAGGFAGAAAGGEAGAAIGGGIGAFFGGIGAVPGAAVGGVIGGLVGGIGGAMGGSWAGERAADAATKH